MAKKRGPVERTVQIRNLSEKIGKKGQQAAAKFVKEYPADVVRLAFRLLPKSAAVSKRDEKRIAALAKKNPKEAEQLRSLLDKTR